MFDFLGAIGAGSAAKKQKEMDMLALIRQQQMFNYAKKLNQPFYDAGLPALGSLEAATTGTVDPNTGRSWTPTDSPAYKWQQDQQQKTLDRRLSSMGRSNSTFGINAATEASGNLAASEYDRQLNRLSNMVNIGRGGAAALTGAGQHYGDVTSQGMNQMGENAANSTLAKYMLWASSLNKLGENAGKAYTGGLFGAGSGGGGSSFGVNAADMNAPPSDFGSGNWFGK